MSAARLDPAGFAAWLTGQGYAPATVRDARKVAARYLTERPELPDLTVARIASWCEAQPVAAHRQTRYRTHLHRLRDYARATIPPAQLAALEDGTDQHRRTVDDFARWLRGTGASPNTIKHRRALVVAFLADHPAFLTVPEDQIETWLQGQRVSAATRNTYRGHLRALFRWAELENLSPATVLHPRAGLASLTGRTAYEKGRRQIAVPSAWQAEIEAWLQWLASGSRPESTLTLREVQLRRFAADNAHLAPYSVALEDLAGWLAGKHWSVETRRSYRSALRNFYGWAHRSGRIGHDPAALLPSIRPARAIARPAPEEAIRDALAVADDRVTLMLRLGAELGLRRFEIAQVHADDLTRDGYGNPALTVVGKGGHQRRLPLSADLADLIASHAATTAGGYLFPSVHGGHLSAAYVGKLISRALPDGQTSHRLRHRFATVVYAPTRDLFTVQTLLGHSSPMTTRRYVELPPDALRTAVTAAHIA